MSLDDKITNLILREPGIPQNQIVKELTRDKKSSKNTVIKHVQVLVKEKKIKEEKHGKFVQYFATNVETHKDIDKLVHHKLDDAFDSLDRIKKQISSYPYDAKEYLLNYLDEIKKIEEEIQNNINWYQNNIISQERHLASLPVQISNYVEEMELSLETKNQIYKIVSFVHDKLQKLNREYLEYKEKFRNTQDKKMRVWIKKHLRKIELDTIEPESDLEKIKRSLEFESKNIEEIITKLYEQYINEKPSVYTQIQKLSSERRNILTVLELPDICYKIKIKLDYHDTHIDECNQQLKNTKNMDDVDDVLSRIIHDEKEKEKLEKDLEKILQHLKTKKPLVNLFEQLKQKYP